MAVALAALAPISCGTKEPEQNTYFDRTISPILTTSCVRTNTGAGCHVADAKGNALGNLDTASFEGVDRRRDLLADYGPYGQPAFLLKNIEPISIEVQSYDGTRAVVTTDVKHAGGSILSATGSAYQTLRRWIQNGATKNNTGAPPKNVDRQPCSQDIPARADFDLSRDPARGDFAIFRDKVIPVMQGEANGATSCVAGNCHGTVANTLYLTCGGSPEQVRWNYLAASEYLAQNPEQSELLRRPLSPSAGGAFHEGGVIFQTPSDEGYRAFDEWARAHGPPTARTDPGFTFFAHKVQPLLVKKGCMMLQCHSASMFHDFRLRGGSSGSFSLGATNKNYELSLQQMALESDDIRTSRMVRKNLYRPEVCSVGGCQSPKGIVHRGGPLFEDFGGEAARPDLCVAGSYDYDNGDLDKIPGFCVMNEWLRRERQVLDLGPMTHILYVTRAVGSVRRAQDFDVYTANSDLRRVGVTVQPNGKITTSVAAGPQSVSGNCGLDRAAADIRRPQVSWDGKRAAFAARASAAEPLAIYEIDLDTLVCAKHPIIGAHPPSQNGLLIHDFDPVYAPPDGGFSRIVFASTRGNVDGANYDYQGPQRSPADPTKPNANLYVLEPDPGAPGQTRIRQLTYLLNMERHPSFMNDGRLIFTAEKRAPGFYQLALRRLNLDGGDYHPLYAQRGSIAFPEASQVVELADKDFATIMSDRTTPHGGGALAVFNRSIGIDFQSGNAADYPIDPTVLDPAAPQSPDPAFFLRSLRFPDGKMTSGLYTSPSALPDGRILVSFGLAPFNGDYDLWVMDPITGVKEKLLGDAVDAEVDAVAVYPRFPRPIFRSALDEPNGHVRLRPGDKNAEVTVLDTPVLASLLFQNTPTGRLIDPEIDRIEVYEDLPPPPDVDSFAKGGTFVANDAFGSVYVRRRILGTVPTKADRSARFLMPGGLPIVMKLPDTKLSRERNLPRWQREEMVFGPGEYAHQSFPERFFDALCGHCHGATSGKAIDVALDPDFVTQASATVPRNEPATLIGATRGDPIGPPPTP